MKKRERETRRTARLILEPFRGIDSLTEKERVIAQSIEALPPRVEGDGFYSLLTIREKKSGRLCGVVQCAKAEEEGTAEINLQLYAAKNVEKTASEAIKAPRSAFLPAAGT